MENGQFREDFYYRLSADRIRTPSLAEQIRERPEVLYEMVRFSVRVAGKAEAQLVADETLAYLKKIPADYPWPGNVRELEQCIRNILIRQNTSRNRCNRKRVDWTSTCSTQQIGRCSSFNNAYATLIYRRERSHEQAGKLLKVDPRTVKTHVKKFEESDS